MLNRLRSIFSREKQSTTGRTIITGDNKAVWTPRDYKAFAEEGFQKNVVVYQAVDKTARSVGTIPWIAKRSNGDILESHPLLDLIKNPNPLQSCSEFIEAVVGYHRIAGNSYIERVMVGGKPKELYTPRPDRMKVIATSSGMPGGYKYTVNQESVTWLADNMTGESDIRHIKTFNPLNDWYGMSPLEAGAYSVDIHSQSAEYIQALLQNGAAPSGALEVEQLSDDEYNRLKAEIEEKYSGSRNAGRPLLLEGGMKWVAMGLSPQAVGIIEIKYSSARDISLALGVPPLLLNIPGDSTYSNYKEARLAFYEETVLPLAMHIRDELNSWLSKYFDGVMLDLDLDQVPAIADKRRELWAMADASTDLTINEKREIKGYDKVEGGDTVYINSGMIPLTFDLQQPDDADPDAAAAEAYGNGNGE